MKNKEKLVSVILNCHNGEQFLKEALDSVINQTYKNWELIFWDNQSNDKSKSILQSFKNKKFKYFKSKKFTSLYVARNLAIKKTKGEFISFIDADDTWEPDKLEMQIKYFNDKNVALVYGNLWIKREPSKKKKLFINYKIQQGYIYQNLIQNYNIGILTTVIRKKYLKKFNKVFIEKYNIIGDFDFFLRLSKKYKFKAVQKPVATYRIHNKNYSILNKDLEAKELEVWLKKNRRNLTVKEYKHLRKKILQIKFVNLKYKYSLFKTLVFFFSNISFLLNIKNILILFLPNFILRKFIRFF
jgi:glycosyltransferase involved in cell wall biosynthesis